MSRSLYAWRFGLHTQPIEPNVSRLLKASGRISSDFSTRPVDETYWFKSHRFNKERDDFATEREYNDYLEMVEDISEPRQG